jgi:hypothetical protein
LEKVSRSKRPGFSRAARFREVKKIAAAEKEQFLWRKTLVRRHFRIIGPSVTNTLRHWPRSGMRAGDRPADGWRGLERAHGGAAGFRVIRNERDAIGLGMDFRN